MMKTVFLQDTDPASVYVLVGEPPQILNRLKAEISNEVHIIGVADKGIYNLVLGGFKDLKLNDKKFNFSPQLKDFFNKYSSKSPLTGEYRCFTITEQNLEAALNRVLYLIESHGEVRDFRFYFNSFWISKLFTFREYLTWGNLGWNYKNGNPIPHRDLWEKLISYIEDRKLLITGAPVKMSFGIIRENKRGSRKRRQKVEPQVTS
jgi:hypothetical protein